MKKILFITILLLKINASAQVETEKKKDLKNSKSENISKNDTILNVTYKNEIEDNNKPLFFLNNKIVNEGILKTIIPNSIENIKVEKEEVEIDNKKYYGKIFIETKSNNKPKLISLNNLKLKYTNIKENSTIFLIDNEVINADYEKFLVDQNYILKIEVEKIDNKEEKLKLNIVNLITKSEENIRKSKIRYRGGNEFTINK
ncbi:MAG TPA: hypothetical protein VIV55_06000 [Flavobacterium sp.]